MIDRYSRQVILNEIGEEGQRRLSGSKVVIVGCGGLGGMIAISLVRAGIGDVRIIDRDIVEYHNLHRQLLFGEDDVKNRLPKAQAAERYLKKVNSSIKIEGVVADVHHANIEKLVAGYDLIMDGLDNDEARFLINDVSLKYKIPWIYGGAISTSGMTMNIIPGKTPCFRCVFPSPPPRGIIPTCDNAGVIGPAPYIVGSMQSVEAIKMLIGAKGINTGIMYIDIWQGTMRRVEICSRRDCPACQGKYEFLEGKLGLRTTVLCGQNSVQVSDPGVTSLSLAKLAARLKATGAVSYDKSRLTFMIDNKEVIIFPDGRLILRNSLEESLARELYTRYIGNLPTEDNL